MKVNSIHNKQSIALRVSLPFIVIWIPFRSAILISYLFAMRECMTLQATANYVIGIAEITHRTGLRSFTIFSLFNDLSYRRILPNTNTLIQSTQYGRMYLNHKHYWLRSWRWRQHSVPKHRSPFCCLLQQIHSLSQSEFSSRCDLALSVKFQ